MKEISERVAQGESFLITKNSEVIFEIKPKIKEESEKLPIVVNKQRIIRILQLKVQEKMNEVAVLNQHINILLKDENL